MCGMCRCAVYLLMCLYTFAIFATGDRDTTTHGLVQGPARPCKSVKSRVQSSISPLMSPVFDPSAKSRETLMDSFAAPGAQHVSAPPARAGPIANQASPARGAPPEAAKNRPPTYSFYLGYVDDTKRESLSADPS